MGDSGQIRGKALKSTEAEIDRATTGEWFRDVRSPIEHLRLYQTEFRNHSLPSDMRLDLSLTPCCDCKCPPPHPGLHGVRRYALVSLPKSPLNTTWPIEAVIRQ